MKTIREYDPFQQMDPDFEAIYDDLQEGMVDLNSLKQKYSEYPLFGYFTENLVHFQNEPQKKFTFLADIDDLLQLILSLNPLIAFLSDETSQWTLDLQHYIRTVYLSARNLEFDLGLSRGASADILPSEGPLTKYAYDMYTRDISSQAELEKGNIWHFGKSNRYYLLENAKKIHAFLTTYLPIPKAA